MTAIRIKKDHIKQMIDHSREELPNECCGMLFAVTNDDGSIDTTEYRRITNANPSPMSFLMDGREQIHVLREGRKKGNDEFIIVHSHPNGPSRLSSHDKAMAYDRSSVWVLLSHVLDDEPTIQCWRVEQAGVNVDPIDVQIV